MTMTQQTWKSLLQGLNIVSFGMEFCKSIKFCNFIYKNNPRQQIPEKYLMLFQSKSNSCIMIFDSTLDQGTFFPLPAWTAIVVRFLYWSTLHFRQPPLKGVIFFVLQILLWWPQTPRYTRVQSVHRRDHGSCKYIWYIDVHMLDDAPSEIYRRTKNCKALRS